MTASTRERSLRTGLVLGLIAMSAGSLPVLPAADDVTPCTRLIGGLQLDGSLADPIWRSIRPLTGFRTRTGEIADQQTEVRTCYDDTALYVICTCREWDVSVIQASVTERDGDLLRDDCVELYVPGVSGVRRHFAASASGALYDASGDAKTNVAWDSGANTGVQVFKHAWGVEVAIPLKSLGLTAKAGTVVRLNVARRRRRAGELSRLRPAGQFVALRFKGAPSWLEPVAAVKPRSGIRYSAADIRNARRNIRRFTWARYTASSIVSRADANLAKPMEHYLSFMPPKGATFAYGFAGCPKCKANWPRFGRGLCSFDKPGKVTCRQCKAVLPDDDRKSPCHDHGHGVEIGGHMFYFKGVWHAWVINQYKSMLSALSHAYALTGDGRYAERAALLYDAMATLAPSTVGPRDNMRPHQKKVGIFHYYTQQLTEHLRSYLLYYDLIYHSKAMERVSPTSAEDCTVRQNIEKNMFLDTWDVEMNTRKGRLPSLHNHTSATVRAMMGVGLVCGKPDLIRWGIEAAYKFIYNTTDPEGQYYETSGAGYNECGRRCNGSFADMLWNYDPDNYENPSDFPQPKDYPYEIKLYRHPRMRMHLDQALYHMDCAGHIPRYGDAGGDTQVVRDPVGQWQNYRFHWAFAMYRGAATAIERSRYYQKMQAAAKGKVESRLGVDGLFWFRPLDDVPKYNPKVAFNVAESSLWGQRATAILRQGEGRDRMALLMLGGTIFPHGNDDTLHLSLYSQGQMLTHDVGYDLYGRPVHMGWACRSIAHPTVTVDERGGPPLYRGGPNANVMGFTHTDGLSFVAMSAGPQCWLSQPAVKQYDRACALVKLPGGGGYFVDLFNVRGGSQHDYSFHGQTTQKGEGFTLQGADPKPIENVWTLAGLSGHADATFDAPGRSWGERCMPGNRIRKLDIPGEKVGYFSWWPPPANGYGFLYEVRLAPASETVVADWTTQESRNIHLRLHLLPGPDTTLITARGPDLTGKWAIPFVIARRKGEDLASSFLGVMEGYTDTPQVTSVEEAPPLRGMRGLVVTGKQDYTDRIWLSTDGRLAFARAKQGKTVGLALHQCSCVEHGGVSLALECPRLTGKVTSVDYDGHAIDTNIAPQSPAALLGQRLLVSSPDYACNSSYRIETCGREGRFGFGLVGFGRGMADYRAGKDVLVSSTPVPLAWTGGRPRATGLLDGKLARSPDGGRSGLIKEFVNRNQYRLKPGHTIERGDTFTIYDVKAGDRLAVPMTATLRLLGDGMWELRATCDVVVSLGQGQVTYRSTGEQWLRAERHDSGFVIPASQMPNGRTRLRGT